jgi:hypothetical protein
LDDEEQRLVGGGSGALTGGEFVAGLRPRGMHSCATVRCRDALDACELVRELAVVVASCGESVDEGASK